MLNKKKELSFVASSHRPRRLAAGRVQWPALIFGLTLALTGASAYYVKGWPNAGAAVAAQERPANTLALAEVPSHIRQQAQKHIAGAVTSKVAPNWRGARLGEPVLLLYRPDVAGVAYYEIPVLAGGAAAGVIVLASGAHDFPVVFWNNKGQGEGAKLLAQARAAQQQVGRIYRLTPFQYAAEDKQGELLPISRAALNQAQDLVMTGNPAEARAISGYVYEPPAPGLNGRVKPGAKGDEWTLGPQKSPYQTRPFRSWADLKARFGESFRLQLDALRQQAQAARAQSARGLTSAPILREVQLADEGPWYGQIPANSGVNTTPCASGCGATAWAIVAGWYDRVAARSASGSGQAAFGPLFTQPIHGGVDVAAPTDRGGDVSDVSQMIMDIREKIWTQCSLGIPAGWTIPSQMNWVRNWLKDRGVDGNVGVSDNYSNWFIADASYRDLAMRFIDNNQPAVLGISSGTDLHYPVAMRYRIPADGSKDDAEFWINKGWGRGQEGWIPASTWFAGTLTLKPPATNPNCSKLPSGPKRICCNKPWLPMCDEIE